jgi:hypothetical protein
MAIGEKISTACEKVGSVINEKNESVPIDAGTPLGMELDIKKIKAMIEKVLEALSAHEELLNKLTATKGE